MQHLNIPLSRHTKTTRPLGLVVWLLAGAFLFCALLLWCIGGWWFTRSSILALAPSDTILALEFRLNEKTAPFLLDWLSGVPLISGRSLELRDLARSIHGDVALFLTKDGGRSVAIRTSNEEIDSDLMEQFAISAQEEGPFVLLSSALAPITGMTKQGGNWRLPSMTRIWIGRLTLPTAGLTGNVFLSQTALTIEWDRRPSTEAVAKAPISDASLLMRGLSWGESGSPLDSLSQILAGLSGESMILESSSALGLYVRPREGSLEILLSVEDPGATHEAMLNELRRMGALAGPTISSQSLPDGSVFEEILVQPELVSIEELSTSLGLAYHVPTQGGGSILAAKNEAEVVFANSLKLLEDYMAGSSEASGMCGQPSSWLNPAFLIDQVNSDRAKSELALLERLFSYFSSISFEFKKYSTSLSFCII